MCSAPHNKSCKASQVRNMEVKAADYPESTGGPVSSGCSLSELDFWCSSGFKKTVYKVLRKRNSKRTSYVNTLFRWTTALKSRCCTGFTLPTVNPDLHLQQEPSLSSSSSFWQSNQTVVRNSWSALILMLLWIHTNAQANSQHILNGICANSWIAQ